MAPNTISLNRKVFVINELGLHARTAAMLAKIAQQASGRVWIEKDGERADARQVIDILMLAAAQGDQLQVTIETPADIEYLNKIVSLFKSGFGE
ncbi:MAG: HPr family phosphocarrier protein [Desulfobacteraceae bacterium]|nr:HPr family phosphocarrier protein [Desulfobacteraceae bacterium]